MCFADRKVFRAAVVKKLINTLYDQSDLWTKYVAEVKGIFCWNLFVAILLHSVLIKPRIKNKQQNSAVVF